MPPDGLSANYHDDINALKFGRKDLTNQNNQDTFKSVLVSGANNKVYYTQQIRK